jgi:hypothetical protein
MADILKEAGGPSPLPRKWWAAVAAAVLVVPGVLLGVVARLFVPDGGQVWCWAAAGAALGAVVGALLEADHRL